MKRSSIIVLVLGACASGFLYWWLVASGLGQ